MPLFILETQLLGGEYLMKANRVYLAGPDVFREDAKQFFNDIKGKMMAMGLNGLSPMDCDSDNAYEIFKNNLNLIRSADFVLANLDPFRGASVDSGTATEIGYALALDKIVVGYYSAFPNEYKKRIGKCFTSQSYPVVEDFGLFDNLMIVYSCRCIFIGIDGALKFIKENVFSPNEK